MSEHGKIDSTFPIRLNYHVGSGGKRLEKETDEELSRISGLPIDIIKRWPRDEDGMMLNAWSDKDAAYYGNPACGRVSVVQYQRAKVEWGG